MKLICTAATLRETIKELKKLGYNWVCGNLTAEEIRKQNPRTKYFVIDAYFNPLRGKNEMQYESETFYKKHNLI